MMINFKKEGYFVGQKLFMVNNKFAAFESVVCEREVEVTHVGPSTLKVTDGQNEFKFKGKTNSKGVIVDVFFKLYQNEADYLRIKGEEENENRLRKEITEALGELSLKDLRLLSDYLKQMK